MAGFEDGGKELRIKKWIWPLEAGKENLVPARASKKKHNPADTLIWQRNEIYVEILTYTSIK